MHKKTQRSLGIITTHREHVVAIISRLARLAQGDTSHHRTRKREEEKEAAERHALKRLEAVLARVVVEVNYAPC
jgi:uncharacterized protein YkuJ